LSEDGKLEIEVPRDRAGEFEPQFIPKGQRRFGGFDQKVIAMYAQGVVELLRNACHICADRFNRESRANKHLERQAPRASTR